MLNVRQLRQIVEQLPDDAEVKATWEGCWIELFEKSVYLDSDGKVIIDADQYQSVDS